MPVGDPTLGEFGVPTDLTDRAERPQHLSGWRRRVTRGRPAVSRSARSRHAEDRAPVPQRWRALRGLRRARGGRWIGNLHAAGEPHVASQPDPARPPGRRASARSRRSPTRRRRCRPAEKQLLTFDRADGVKLSATLYVPASRKGNERLPMILWAYPREFTDAAAASQVSGSPYRYNVLSFGNIYLMMILQGYAVVDPVDSDRRIGRDGQRHLCRAAGVERRRRPWTRWSRWAWPIATALEWPATATARS